METILRLIGYNICPPIWHRKKNWVGGYNCITLIWNPVCIAHAVHVAKLHHTGIIQMKTWEISFLLYILLLGHHGYLWILLVSFKLNFAWLVLFSKAMQCTFSLQLIFMLNQELREKHVHCKKCKCPPYGTTSTGLTFKMALVKLAVSH